MSEDNQAEEIETSAPEPKPEPLFTLDLGTNGGVLAPTGSVAQTHEQTPDPNPGRTHATAPTGTVCGRPI